MSPTPFDTMLSNKYLAGLDSSWPIELMFKSEAFENQPKNMLKLSLNINICVVNNKLDVDIRFSYS